MTPEEQERIQHYLRKIRLAGILSDEENQDMADTLRREMEAEPWKEGRILRKGQEN